MGTRADFYVGKGESAEWIGSIAWDGYPDGIAVEIREASTPDAFREAVTNFLKSRDDLTLPSDGWPWPWNDSGTTDYSYWHYDGKTWGSCFGGGVFAADMDQPEDDEELGEPPVMPDMAGRKSVAHGKRSGRIVIGG